jgi:hypothetical protein
MKEIINFCLILITRHLTFENLAVQMVELLTLLQKNTILIKMKLEEKVHMETKLNKFILYDKKIEVKAHIKNPPNT